MRLTYMISLLFGTVPDTVADFQGTGVFAPPTPLPAQDQVLPWHSSPRLRLSAGRSQSRADTAGRSLCERGAPATPCPRAPGQPLALA